MGFVWILCQPNVESFYFIASLLIYIEAQFESCAFAVSLVFLHATVTRWYGVAYCLLVGQNDMRRRQACRGLDIFQYKWTTEVFTYETCSDTLLARLLHVAFLFCFLNNQSGRPSAPRHLIDMLMLRVCVSSVYDNRIHGNTPQSGRCVGAFKWVCVCIYLCMCKYCSVNHRKETFIYHSVLLCSSNCLAILPSVYPVRETRSGRDVYSVSSCGKLCSAQRAQTDNRPLGTISKKEMPVS